MLAPHCRNGGCRNVWAVSILSVVYCKVASFNTSRLEVHAGFFRLLMMEMVFRFLCAVTFWQKVDLLIRTPDYTIFETKSNILKLIYIHFLPTVGLCLGLWKENVRKKGNVWQHPFTCERQEYTRKDVSYIHANILICTYTQTMVHCILYQFIGILYSLMLKGMCSLVSSTF